MNPGTPIVLEVSVAFVVGIPYIAWRQAGVTTVLHDAGAASALAVSLLELGTGPPDLAPWICRAKSVLGWIKLMCCCKSAGIEYANVLVSCVGPLISVYSW